MTEKSDFSGNVSEKYHFGHQVPTTSGNYSADCEPWALHLSWIQQKNFKPRLRVSTFAVPASSSTLECILGGAGKMFRV